MCIKGLVLSFVSRFHFDIDRDVSTVHCRSSTGDSVDLLIRTICTTVVVSDWCITNLAHGWWISVQSIVGQYCERKKLIPQRSAVAEIGWRVVPVDVVRVKSYVDSLLNSTRVPVRVSVNKRNLVPERIMPVLIDVFRNGQSLRSWKPYIPQSVHVCNFRFRQYILCRIHKESYTLVNLIFVETKDPYVVLSAILV